MNLSRKIGLLVNISFWVLSVFVAKANAHPVAFQGAWGLMFYNQSEMLDWEANYSLTPRFAISANYFRDLPQNRSIGLLRTNFLLNRWNGEDYQANIYFSAGYGAGFDNQKINQVFFGSLEADYETRKVYFSTKNNILYDDGLSPMSFIQLRAGFAPYVVDTNSLHSWVILQTQYFPSNNNWNVGPVLRLFYRNILWELGVNQRGGALFNFMTHF
jgi:hypothetical protein